MLTAVYLLAFALVVNGHDSPRICAWSRLPSSVNEESNKLPEQQVDRKNNQVTCNKGAYCFAFWRRDPTADNSSRITVFSRGECLIFVVGFLGLHFLFKMLTNLQNEGPLVITALSGRCWEASGRGDGCSSSVCLPISHPSKIMGTARFCCCTGYLCNLNISVNAPSLGVENHTQNLPLPRNATELRAGEGEQIKALVLGGCVASLVLLLLAGIVWKFGPNVHDKDAKNDRSRNHSSASQNTASNNSYSVSQLSLDRIVGQGKYGTVWLGYLKDKPVAVKMFPAHYQQYFFNEKDIYTLPFMDHVSLLTYYGDDRIKNKDGTTSLALVLSYCPLGTLQEYLKGNTVDLMTFTNMALSITSALAFLHTDVHKQGANKPCVTHRDVNSRNILIKEDLSCCLADLSLSVKIAGSHYYALDDELHAETKSINDVGTLRYMAPEILEGAVNLRDCESSMKQIDVYALGLVLWELSMRVTDFFHRPSDVPPYSMPFEREVGLHPTFEEMQVLVCRNKARPLYPFEWKNNSATTTIRETIEDCTDQDGEARLTALCVHERINQIRKAHSQNGNISPTINPTNFSTSAFSSTYCYTNNISPTPEITFGEKETNDGCGSEDTVETIVTMTPSDSFHTHHSLYNRDVTMIHPHQGRNPCQERNLLNSDQREEQICIVQTSNKHATTTTEIEIVPRPQSSTAGQLASIPIVQNRPFTSPKLINLVPRTVDPPDVNFVSSLFKMMKKKDKNCADDDEETALTRVIVSPFEGETSPQRPSSLQLLPSTPVTSDVNIVGSFTEEKALKELSGRIRTPGDLPPSVRKKRGSKARLSLYDDRMMSYSALDSTF